MTSEKARGRRQCRHHDDACPTRLPDPPARPACPTRRHQPPWTEHL